MSKTFKCVCVWLFGQHIMSWTSSSTSSSSWDQKAQHHEISVASCQVNDEIHFRFDHLEIIWLNRTVGRLIGLSFLLSNASGKEAKFISDWVQSESDRKASSPQILGNDMSSTGPPICDWLFLFLWPFFFSISLQGKWMHLAISYSTAAACRVKSAAEHSQRTIWGGWWWIAFQKISSYRSLFSNWWCSSVSDAADSSAIQIQWLSRVPCAPLCMTDWVDGSSAYLLKVKNSNNHLLIVKQIA